MRKTAWNVFTFFMVAMFFSVSLSATENTKVEEVKIGFAAPLSGPQAIYGKDIQAGVILAIEEFNAKKEYIGGQPVKFILISADDKASIPLGTEIAEKMVDQDIKGMLGHMNSSVSIAASKIYHDAGIPQISAATAPEFTRQNFNTVFRMLPSDVLQGEVLANFVVKKLGFKEIAIIDDRTSYGQGLANEFQKTAKIAGAKIVRHEFSSDQAYNFKPLLIGLKRFKPQAILYAGNAVQAGPLAKQMRELGLKSVLIGGDMLKTSEFIRLAGAAADGSIVSVASKPLNEMPGGVSFSKRYFKRFGNDAGPYAPYAYDATMVMLNAMQHANSVDPQKYLPYLSKIKMSGITAKKIAYDEYGDLLYGAMSIYQVVDHDWHILNVINKATPKNNNLM